MDTTKRTHKKKLRSLRKKKQEKHSSLMKANMSENQLWSKLCPENQLWSKLCPENQLWSKLCPDILRPIFESLSSIDYHRAKTVCSDWYYVWKTCVRLPLCPWQLTYQGDSSVLFDDSNEDKSHKTKPLGVSRKSYCIASCGNWLFMVSPRIDFYILNLLTRKRIILPLHPDVRRGWCQDSNNGIVGVRRSALLWINERTEDYFVALILNHSYLFTHKKGDNRDKKWNLNNINAGLFDMAYKNNKLYLYTLDHLIKILDFSGDSPKVEGRENPYQDHPFRLVEQSWEYIWKRKIVIRNSGEVLIILSLKEAIHDEENFLFYIFKMNLGSGKWERVYSIGDDEMLIFGHGVTIRAPVQDVGDGIKSDSICFVDYDLWPDVDRPANCGIFDLATSKITWPKRFGVYIDQTQWFVQG